LTEFYTPERQTRIEDPRILREKNIHDKSLRRGKHDLTDKQIRFILHRCGSIIEKMGYTEILFAYDKREAKKMRNP
jgi:hypothetical protein